MPSTRRGPFIVVACLLLALSGCARKRPTPQVPWQPAPGWSETGIASWYGNPYHGRQAASGEVYDMEQFTAAHRTLPFGAIVRVTNSTNHKNVDVRINDRGPFVDGRIIDLSRAAARSIDLIGPGTARVRIVLLSYSNTTPSNSSGGAFAVQVGNFSDRKRAEKLRDRLSRQYDPVEISPRPGSPKQWRVLVGRKTTEADARSLAETLRLEHQDAFVVRLDLE